MSLAARSTVACAALALSCMGTPTPLVPGLSGSVGVPHHGVQTSAVELPAAGPGFLRYRPHGTAYWGNPRLVKAIMDAAAFVAEQRPGGAPLLLGDLSARQGGKIPRHNSHRTGRDVDVLWYLTTPAGAPLQNPGFVNVGPDGLASLGPDGQYARIDLERQWLFVKHLLTSKDVSVQWMFCSSAIEALLIDYAIARGEPLELVWRAETVLLEPGDSLPHDDHIHLRIACAPDELVAGCEGGGPYWEWLPPMPRLASGDDWLYAVAAQDPPPDYAEEPVVSVSENAEAPEG